MDPNIRIGFFKKGAYIGLVIKVIFYMVLVFFLWRIQGNSLIFDYALESSTVKGIILQFQMIVSILLVLNHDKWGFRIALFLNSISLMYSIGYIFYNGTYESFPGIISYVCVIFIVSLIYTQFKKNEKYVAEISQQNHKLENSKEMINQMTCYDLLTQLPNRSYFEFLLSHEVTVSKRTDKTFCIIFMDIDSFKHVNDSLGHEYADEILLELVSRLKNSLRNNDVIARFGSDEFAIMITNLKSVECIEAIIDKIKIALSEPYLIENHEFFITVSMGISVFPLDGEFPNQLIENAELAMFTAKTNGKNTFAFYSNSIKNEVTYNMLLTNQLYRAIDKNELMIYYQPQVNTKTKEIIGFEALLRWHNHEFGWISPNDFIPIAEKTGLIISIGLWVFRTVCEQCQICKKSSAPSMRISINMSIEQLKEKSIIDDIKKIVIETQSDPQSIQIEVTESVAFIENDLILTRLNALKILGFSIAIDDFGTGHSSLSRLKQFPIDLIKIDMEFVQGIHLNSGKDRAIVESIIQIAKNLNIPVLAEGVETEEQYLFLKNQNCDEVQGYYFYKPMPPEEIFKLL